MSRKGLLPKGIGDLVRLDVLFLNNPVSRKGLLPKGIGDFAIFDDIADDFDGSRKGLLPKGIGDPVIVLSSPTFVICPERGCCRKALETSSLR